MSSAFGPITLELSSPTGGVVTASSIAGLALTFVVGGLREIGEPARKALIVDRSEPHLRARSVGLYYLIRSLAITPAAFVGGLLWDVAARAPFYVAGAIGAAGTLLFALTVDEDEACLTMDTTIG